MTDRVAITPEQAAKIMFASDRTCCVCRDSRRKTKIHHIDSDPGNNDPANLAVLCDDCHSDAHTKHAFARNLTPDLIHEYNGSWREIVALRLSPHTEKRDEREYQIEVLLELGLVPYLWKNDYLILYPGHFQDAKGATGDVWDLLERHPKHRYSEEEWKTYRPLFVQSISNVISRIERILMVHASAVPTSLKTNAVRLIRQLEVEQFAYLTLPKLPTALADPHLMFRMRFVEVVRILREYARQVDEVRTALGSKT